MIITSFYAALLAIFLMVLSINIIRCRHQQRIAIGAADNIEMLRKIRAQGNFIEYTPMFLIMLALAETNGLSGYLLHGLGSIFLISRFSHSYGLLRAECYEDQHMISGSQYRKFGMQCTFAVLMILAVILLMQFASKMIHIMSN